MIGSAIATAIATGYAATHQLRRKKFVAVLLHREAMRRSDQATMGEVNVLDANISKANKHVLTAYVKIVKIPLGQGRPAKILLYIFFYKQLHFLSLASCCSGFTPILACG